MGAFDLHMHGGMSPAEENLLEEFDERPCERLHGRERAVEWSFAAALLVAGVLMAALLHADRSLDPVAVALMVGAYAVMSRIEFAAGAGYTVPTQLVFVPMLLLLPTPLVPLLVALGIVLSNLPSCISGRRHVERAVVCGLSDSWHAVGPALVLVAAGAQEPSWSAWPVLLAALLAQFAFDLSTSAARTWLVIGIAPWVQLRLLAGIYIVDAMFAPVGLLAAFGAAEHPAAVLLVLPLGGVLAVFASERRARIDQALELSQAYHGTALLLGDVVEADDEYTGLHSRSVVSLALEVADRMGLDSRERRNVEFGALLHDVGKIAVPKEIINKPGPLTPEEWQVMETHTLEGQRMLDRVGGVLGEVGQIVRSSHERWDGGGYPDGLAGEQIPLGACIVSCCDAFNAMTTDRSYRSAMTPEVAVAELQANAGTQFHPGVVQVLLELVQLTGAPPLKSVA